MPTTDTPPPQAVDDLRHRIADALAIEFTSGGEHTQGMRVSFDAPDGWPAARMVTPTEAAKAVLAVVQPELDRLQGAEAALAAIASHAIEWQKAAPADDWGLTPQDTAMADIGRFLLTVINLTAKNNPYQQDKATLERVQAAVHIANEEDVTDWQRGYRACAERVLSALRPPELEATKAITPSTKDGAS